MKSKDDKPERVFLNSIDFSIYRNNKNSINPGVGDLISSSIVLYDRACTLCRNEMYRIKARDHDGKLFLLDINSRMFDESLWGITHEEAGRSLHVLTADNRWLVGMPAIRHIYRQVGLGWLAAPTRWPLLAVTSNIAYQYIANNRYVLSRWPGLVKDKHVCTEKVCAKFSL